jgi:phage tail sheath protein FI
MSAATTERPKTVENIKVLQVGKFGVRVDEKTWFGVNEPLTPTHFQVGEGYKVSVTASKTGKKYINEILGQEVQDAPKASAPASQAASQPAQAQATQTTKADAPAPIRAGFGQPLTAYDLAVQRQISRAGVWQAAAQAPITGMATNVDEYLSFVRKIADAGMKYVTE